MKIGALAATAANVLLLTFFIFQSFQSPFGRKGQDGALVDMQRQAMMAAEEHFKLGSPSAESHFKPWIKKDLSTWAQQGIAIVSFCCFFDLSQSHSLSESSAWFQVVKWCFSTTNLAK